MQSLTSVIIRNELFKDMAFNTRKFPLERQRNALKAYQLKHSYYNMTEQGSTSLQLDFETSRQNTIQWSLGTKTCCQANYSNISKTTL
jgi:hypothetical protein